MVDGSLPLIKRPLDFVAVSYHSESMGEACSLMNEGAPGVFTTIHAHEWTSAPGGSNQHRNVFFRNANMPDVPFSSN